MFSIECQARPTTRKTFCTQYHSFHSFHPISLISLISLISPNITHFTHFTHFTQYHSFHSFHPISLISFISLISLISLISPNITHFTHFTNSLIRSLLQIVYILNIEANQVITYPVTEQHTMLDLQRIIEQETRIPVSEQDILLASGCCPQPAGPASQCWTEPVSSS